MSTQKLKYHLNEKPKDLKETLLYVLQWVMVMFYPVVWGYTIVGLGLGFTGEALGLYMMRVIFMIGLSTFIGVLYGHKLSMISGPNIIPSLALVAAYQVGGETYALHAFNAYIIAGFVVMILGFFRIISHIGKVWTPLVSGSMIMMVGLSTSSVGLNLIAQNNLSWMFIVGILLALLCGYLSIKGKGVLATIPVLITLVLGYIIFIATNQFDWTLVRTMPIFKFPDLFPYGLSIPPIDLIVTMTIVNLFSAVNLYGNVQGYTHIIDHTLTKQDEKRYFTVFGLVDGIIASIFGVPSHVAYGENLGFVLLTKVASRFLMMIAATTFIVMSFFGPIGGMMAAMPLEIAGAILLGVACTLIGIGANVWHQHKDFSTREIFIVGFSIFLAFGLNTLPDAFYQDIPRLLGTLFKNPVITVIIIVIILEQLIFKQKKED